MIRNAGLWSAILLVALAPSAFAGEGKETKISETISLFGGNTPELDFLTQTKEIVGVRYQLHVPLGQGHHWTASPGFSYGYGRWKDDQTTPPPGRPATDELTTTAWDGMLDFLYYNGCCDDDDFYCGPGLFYSSAKLKEKQTGSPDATFDPYKTFGVQLTVGGGIPLSPKLELTANLTERAGLSTFDRKGGFFGAGYEDKFSGVTYSTQFGGGLRVRF